MTFFGIPDEKVRSVLVQMLYPHRKLYLPQGRECHPIPWASTASDGTHVGHRRQAELWPQDVAWEHLALGKHITRGVVTLEGLWSESGWPRIDYLSAVLWAAAMWAELSGTGLLILGSAAKLCQQSSHLASGWLAIASWHLVCSPQGISLHTTIQERPCSTFPSAHQGWWPQLCPGNTGTAMCRAQQWWIHSWLSPQTLEEFGLWFSI